MRTIYDFTKGDEIVRVQPAKPYSPERITAFGVEGGTRDRSYLGAKLIFVGIANGQIYLRRTDEFSLSLFGDELLDLDLDLWDEGWEFYIEPKTLLECAPDVIDEAHIQSLISKAIEEEDYEKAGILKRRLNY